MFRPLSWVRCNSGEWNVCTSKAVVSTALIALCVVSSYSHYAAEVLTLQEAETLALVDEPGIAAFEAQLAASADLAIAESQLPDPHIQVGTLNYPLESGGFSQEGMTQIRIDLKQSFPPAQQRRAAASYRDARSTELVHLIDERRLEITRKVRKNWLGVYYELQAERLLNASLDQLRGLLDVTRSMYAVGLENQATLLNINVEISRMQDEISATQVRQKIMRSQLSQWLQAAANRPLLAEEPPIPQLENLTALEARLMDHPLVRTAGAKVAASVAEIDTAKSHFKPYYTGEVSYALRDGELPNGESRPDFLSVMLGIQLPVFVGKRQDKRLAAALQRNSSAKLQRMVVLRELQSRLMSTFEQWSSLNARIDRYRTTIVPQAVEYADVAVASYQSKVSDFKDVIDSQRLSLQVQLELVRLIVERIRVWAELDYLTDTSDED